MTKPLDAIRQGRFGDARRDACRAAGSAPRVRGLSRDQGEAHGVVDWVVLDGDHRLFQSGTGENRPTVDCIIFVTRTVGGRLEVLMVLVELKAGSLSVSKTRKKFEKSWSDAERVLDEASVDWQRAKLVVLGRGLNREDRRALEGRPPKACHGHQPEFFSGDTPLVTLLPKEWRVV